MGKLEVTKGDATPFRGAAVEVNLVTGVEQPMDLTGTTLWFTAKRDPVADADAVAVVAISTVAAGDYSLGMSIEDAVGGIFSFRIPAAATTGLTDVLPLYLAYDCQVKRTTGKIETIDSGDLIVVTQVTRAS